MKIFLKPQFIVFVLALCIIGRLSAQTVATSVDPKKYEGKWYINAAIPLALDKDWCCTIDNYSLNKKGYIDVLTTYRKYDLKHKSKSLKQKLIPDKNSNYTKFMAKVLIFSAPYWIISVADDYSYAVLGHPDKKYLYFISKKPQMEEGLYQKLVKFSAEQGYDISKIKRQVQE